MNSVNRKLTGLVAWLDAHIAALFVAVGLIFGGLTAFLLPPLFGNDEIVHFPRAYQISQGTLWERKLTGHDYGGSVPVELKQFNDDFRELVQSSHYDRQKLQDLMDYYKHRKAGSETADLAFTSAGVYAPWSYAPSSVGVWMADMLRLPLIWYVWLGRLMSVLVWVALTYWALRLLPTGKFFMAAIALLPTSVVQAANLGMDGVVNGLSWLIIALTFAVIAGRLRLIPIRAVFLAAMCLVLATTKQGYLPIALLPLLIPARLYGFDSVRANIAQVVFGIGTIGLSLFYISKMLPLTSVLHFTQRPGVYVDSHAQILHIMEHPVQTLYIILIQPFTAYAGGVWAGTVGVLTNKTIVLPAVVIGLLYVSLLLAFMSGSRPLRFAGRYAARVGWASLAVGLATFVLISLALYVAFTTVAHPYIEGLQGRYFLPFAPLALGAMNLLPPRWSLRLPDGVCLISVVGILTGLAVAIAAISHLL